MEDLAAEAGLSVAQVSRIEKNERGWSPDSLESLAAAFKVPVVELFDTAKAWQTVPVIGIVGERGVVTPVGNNRTGKQQVKAPAAFGDLLALKVKGEHLYPRHLDGDSVFCAKETTPTHECMNLECFLWLEDGTSVLRTVHAGSKPNHFNIVLHNSPPMYDQVVISCRPVVYTAPKTS